MSVTSAKAAWAVAKNRCELGHDCGLWVNAVGSVSFTAPDAGTWRGGIGRGERAETRDPGGAPHLLVLCAVHKTLVIKKGLRASLFNALLAGEAGPLACSTILANAGLSNTARSANTLRSISMANALFTPFMTLL